MRADKDGSGELTCRQVTGIFGETFSSCVHGNNHGYLWEDIWILTTSVLVGIFNSMFGHFLLFLCATETLFFMRCLYISLMWLWQQMGIFLMRTLDKASGLSQPKLGVSWRAIGTFQTMFVTVLRIRWIVSSCVLGDKTRYFGQDIQTFCSLYCGRKTRYFFNETWEHFPATNWVILMRYWDVSSHACGFGMTKRVFLSRCWYMFQL